MPPLTSTILVRENEKQTPHNVFFALASGTWRAGCMADGIHVATGKEEGSCQMLLSSYESTCVLRLQQCRYMRNPSALAAATKYPPALWHDNAISTRDHIYKIHHMNARVFISSGADAWESFCCSGRQIQTQILLPYPCVFCFIGFLVIVEISRDPEK